MNEADKIVSSMLTKQKLDKFLNYLESRGYGALGLGDASRYGIGDEVSHEFKDMKSRQILSLFKKGVSKISFVTLTLSFEPSDKFLESLKAWFEQNMGKVILVDLTVDKKIVGGAIVVANNHYRDFSILSKIQSGLES